MSLLELIARIRFELEQLGARNAHHDFEHLCRHFARSEITPNILPATGPVSAGGDQGRDFETFTTFLDRSRNPTATFLAREGSKTIVFACTIQRKHGLRAKIESDIATICKAGAPDHIYYFSNQDIPVATRHSLQKVCRDTHGCNLEILDAQALSEQLAQPNVFWIAEQFLRIPSDLFPQEAKATPTAYDNARKKWIDGQSIPVNYADFASVKRGLRRATFSDTHRVDLGRWIAVMEWLLSDDHPRDLRRRATYEICVATLRGLHDLTPRKGLVEEYFSTWASLPEPAALRDATILLSYCSSAAVQGEFQVDTAILHGWTIALIRTIEDCMAKASGPNALAEILFVRSYAAQLQFSKGTEPKVDLESLFRWWLKLIAAAKKAILFPVEELADLLTIVAPHVSEDSQFTVVRERLDRLLEKRTSGYVIAEKARDRAVAYRAAGKPLEAIAELQRAKVHWFTGDTLRGSVLAQLALSRIYLELGLVYAAKYYALGAAFVVSNSSDDDLKELIPGALAQVCECMFVGGEWVGLGEMFALYLVVHYRHAPDPDDWATHDAVQSTVFHFVVARAVAKALSKELAADLVAAPIRALSMPEDMRDEVLNPPLPLESYESMSPARAMERASAEIWGRPFADCGSARIYEWRALGITWKVRCANSLSEIPWVEEFVAVLQIAIAEVGRHDLCLLPTTVELEIAVTDTGSIRILDLPGNTSASFQVAVTRGEPSMEGARRRQAETLAVATSLLAWCSCLKDAEIVKRLSEAYRNGLPLKAFSVRPYSELFLAFCERNDYESKRAREVVPNSGSLSFAHREASPLAWCATPGPGYSVTKSHEFIRNRYRRISAAIPITLDRLRREAEFLEWVSKQRTTGMLDWHILLVIMNAAINFRVPPDAKLTSAERAAALRELANKPETADDTQFTLSNFLDVDAKVIANVVVAAIAQTWALHIKSSTPDFVALKRLLDVRYRQATDDVPHDDPFVPKP